MELEDAETQGKWKHHETDQEVTGARTKTAKATLRLSNKTRLVRHNEPKKGE
jgi:hypothetical protein